MMVLLVLEFLKAGIVYADLLCFVSLELDIECLWFSVDATIEVFVIECEFAFAFVILQPLCYLVFHLLLLLISILISRIMPRLQYDLLILQPQHQRKPTCPDIKSNNPSFHLLLVRDFQAVTLIHFHVAIKGTRNYSILLTHYLNT